MPAPRIEQASPAQMVDAAIREAGLSRSQVQRLSGVPVSNLSSWLLRKMSPNTGNWLAVVNACGYRVVLERDDGAGR